MIYRKKSSTIDKAGVDRVRHVSHWSICSFGPRRKPQLLKTLTSPSKTPTYKGGVITVDSIEAHPKDAGELVKVDFPVGKMLEAGAVLQERYIASGSVELSPWLQDKTASWSTKALVSGSWISLSDNIC